MEWWAAHRTHIDKWVCRICLSGKNGHMRIATWNIKQAVAPKKPLAELWDFAAEVIAPDVMVFTEAKVPKEGVPEGWTAVWREEGIGERRRWGTVIAARGCELVDVTHLVSHTWPGTVTIVDVMKHGKCLATVVGIYGLTVDLNGNSTGSGEDSIPQILEDIRGLLNSKRRKKLVIAGDFNLWPVRMPEDLYNELYDVVEETFATRQPLENCSGCTVMNGSCGHMWTHNNGNKPGSKVQNIDYIFVSKKLKKKLKSVEGGVADFPDIWEMSDHAPVVVELSL